MLATCSTVEDGLPKVTCNHSRRAGNSSDNRGLNNQLDILVRPTGRRSTECLLHIGGVGKEIARRERSVEGHANHRDHGLLSRRVEDSTDDRILLRPVGFWNRHQDLVGVLAVVQLVSLSYQVLVEVIT